MENKDISPEISRNTWNTFSSSDSKKKSTGSFEGIGKAKVDSIKERIKEVESLINQREILSAKFIKEAEGMKNQINSFLLESSPKAEDDSEFVRERSELRKKQIEISELQLNEQVGCWRDIALLKKELRDNARELSEKESRSKLIESILEE